MVLHFPKWYCIPIDWYCALDVFPLAKLIKSIEMQYHIRILFFSRGKMTVTYVSYVTYLLSIIYNSKSSKIIVPACFKNINIA